MLSARARGVGISGTIWRNLTHRTGFLATFQGHQTSCPITSTAHLKNSVQCEGWETVDRQLG
jgi:hypothetical protein